LAFFVSRLFGSVTTQIPQKNQLILPALFIYCAIQPFYPIIVTNKEDNDALKMFILFAALMGKYILYISTTSLFENKFVLYYLASTINFQNQIAKESKLFSEIWESGAADKSTADSSKTDTENNPESDENGSSPSDD
jgi:hypothetical protein